MDNTAQYHAPGVHSTSEEPLVCLSNRAQRPPCEWWKASVALISANATDPCAYYKEMYGTETQKFVDAMDSDRSSLMDNGTWNLLLRRNGRNVVSFKYFYNFNGDYTAEGSLRFRYNSLMVARDFSQI